MIQHVCYSRLRLTDFYILSQTDTVLENQTLHSSTCQDSPYLALLTPSPYPASHNQKTYLFEQKSTSGKRKTKSKTVSQFCPDIHILVSLRIINYLREFDKKSLKNCPSGDHLISFHNLSPRLANEIVWRKFMLVT